MHGMRYTIFLFSTSLKLSTNKKNTSWASLVVQWLRLRVPNAGGLGSIPGQGTRSHMPQLTLKQPNK